MPYLEVGQENSGSIELFYEDLGEGAPVVLVHGWPLNGRSWEKQTTRLLKEGFRVISYDRRGFGKSSKPSSGYDYDTFAADLNHLLTELDLQDVALVGFSMGAGEVARYLGSYGADRVSSAVFIAGIPPFLLKAKNNSTGVDENVFTEIKQAFQKDRFAYFTEFFKNFYNTDKLLGKRISKQVVRWSWNAASESSPIGSLESIDAWLTDFREDASKIEIPTLIIHGGEDRILPIESTAKPLQKRIEGSRLVELSDGPHGLLWTHAEEVNAELVKFLSESARKNARSQKANKKTSASRPNLQ